jgi:hypothetical protein
MTTTPKTDKTQALKLTGNKGEAAEVRPDDYWSDHPVSLRLTDSGGRWVSLSFTPEEVAQLVRHLKGITKAAGKKQAAADLAAHRDRVARQYRLTGYDNLGPYSQAMVNRIVELEAAK